MSYEQYTQIETQVLGMPYELNTFRAIMFSLTSTR